MDFMTLAKARYSVRKFSEKPLKEEDIKSIIGAGMIAPTAKNLQPQRVFVLTKKEDLEKVDLCTPCRYGASCVFLICCDKNEQFVRAADGAGSGEIDASIVATHMMLEAAEIGAGTTWVMNFNAEKTREVFALPENYVPVLFLVAGCPAPDSVPSERHTDKKEEKEIVSWPR